MSIERERSRGGCLTLMCDAPKCNEFFESSTHSFAAAIEEAKSEGWQIRKELDEWKHYCPCEEDLGWMQ